jgi:hypothetical protein
MPDNLDKYLPEFDEDAVRARLAGFSAKELTDMLVYAYKEKRVWAKVLDEETKKLRKIRDILDESSTLGGMPGVPSADDLRRMMDDNTDNRE